MENGHKPSAPSERLRSATPSRCISPEVSTASRPFVEACQAPHHATAVTAPSRPATAAAEAGFDPSAALAGYPSHRRGLVLLPPLGFSQRPRRALEGMTGSPRRGYVESGLRASRARCNRSSQRSRSSRAPEVAPRSGATSHVAHTSWLVHAHRLAGQPGRRCATRSTR